MPLTAHDKLRQLIGEEKVAGGSDADTLFSDEEIEDFLSENEDIERAAYEGWRAKAAKLSNLVDTTEGNAQRKYSQLHDQALEMVKQYFRSSSGPTEGRTRIGRAVRAPMEW